MLTAMDNKTPVAIDIETDSLEANEIWCVVCSWEHKTIVLPWTPYTKEALQRYIYEYLPIFHNASFDVWALRKHGIDIPQCGYWDTMVMSYVWNPRRESHSLDSWGEELSKPKLDYRQACIDAGLIAPDAPKGEEFRIGFNPVMERYAERDGEITIQLFRHLLKLLKTDAKAFELLIGVEQPFIECIIEMQSTGFYMDVDGSKSMVLELEQGTSSAIAKMRELVPTAPGKKVKYRKPHDPAAEGLLYLPEKSDEANKLYVYKRFEPFNPNSGSQIAWALGVLYDWEPEKFTKSGQPATDAEVLEDLDYPLADLLTEHSQLEKARGMVQGYIERLDGRKLYGSFNQCVTLTGRLSSSDPNLQNIPTRGEWGNKIRALFTAPDDWLIVDCDLSNIEGRVLAHYLAKLCGDTFLADVFKAGEDLHQANADLWGVSRPEAKTFLYAFLYGAGDLKLGSGDKQRGKALREKVEDKAPSLVQLKEMVWDACRRKDGVIHTNFGRRLVYPEIDLAYSKKLAYTELGKGASKRELERFARGLTGRAERQVFNGVLQGTAADIKKLIALDVRDYQDDYNAYHMAEVHDEGLYLTPVEDAESFAEVLGKCFAKPYLTHCPISGDPKLGKTWAEVH